MKTFIFIFFALFSSFSFADTVIDICYDGLTGVTTYCGDSPDPPLDTSGSGGAGGVGSDGSGSGSGTGGSTSGILDPTTHTCSNGVAPVADAIGALTCPAFTPTVVKIAASKVDPNPSKDDIPCDPSKSGTTGDCASETTAKKANELASETNSKLGSIANSSATSSGLLGKILDGIKGIGSGSGSSSSSSGSGSGSGSNSPPPDKPDAPSDPLTNDLKTVDFSQSMSSLGSCPSAISFNVLGNFYSISYQPLCDFAQGIRGVVITLGAFSALAVVVTAL